MIILLVVLIVLVISIIWTNSRGAPWVPTPMSMVHEMLNMAEVGPNDLVYDLGCGAPRGAIKQNLKGKETIRKASSMPQYC